MYIFDNPEFYTIENLKVMGMYPLTHLSAYGMMPYLKRMQGDLIGTEVGVLKGENVHALLESLPQIKKIYGVDHYLPHTDYSTTRTEEDMRQYKEVAEKNLNSFADRYELIEKDSVQAIYDGHFEDNSLDFVLIDGEHTYEAILKDLELYWPKVKKGGYIFIHDSHVEDVKNAVMDFRRDNKIRIPLHMSKNFLYFWQKTHV
jgi:hypothetical protein